jgi:hypothetical protein
MISHYEMLDIVKTDGDIFLRNFCSNIFVEIRIIISLRIDYPKAF